jgi:hypothetical protein
VCERERKRERERERERSLQINSQIVSLSKISILLVSSGVNFTNILRAPFAPIFLCQRSINLEFKFQKDTCTTFVRKKVAQKMLVKLTRSI